MGRLTGDSILCKATASGSTTTFTDVLNLNAEAGIFKGRLGIFSGGTANNLGSIVRITDNDKDTQTLTFTSAVAEATAALDELELWNERDEGVSPDLIHDLINDAIRDVAGRSAVPVTSDALDFLSINNVIDIDLLEVATVVSGNAWEAITGVDRYCGDDESGDWYKLPTADIEVDRYARTITIGGMSRFLADGYQIRVRGANLPDEITTDSATTAVDFEWITNHVAAEALNTRLAKAYDKDLVTGQMLKMQARADQVRAKTQLTLKGRFWRLT